MAWQKKFQCELCGKEFLTMGTPTTGGLAWHIATAHPGATAAPVQVPLPGRAPAPRAAVPVAQRAGDNCISGNWKDMLTAMVNGGAPAQALVATIQGAPLCEGAAVSRGRPVAPAYTPRDEVKRGKAAEWNPHPVGTPEHENFITYYGAKGQAQGFSSPTALMAQLGLRTSGTQACPIGDAGKQCRVETVKSQFYTLVKHGHTVWANGPDTPLPEKAAVSSVRHFTVFDRSCPQNIIQAAREGKTPPVGGAKPIQVPLPKKPAPAPKKPESRHGPVRTVRPPTVQTFTFQQ